MSSITVKATSLALYPDEEERELTFTAHGIDERFVSVDGDIPEAEAFYIETITNERQWMIQPSMVLAPKGTMLNFVGVIQLIWFEYEDKLKIAKVEGDIGESKIPFEKGKDY